LGRAACLLRNGYLLAERGDLTILIDLRALLVARHYRHLTAPGGDTLLTSQPLLLPESLNLDADAARLWRERGGALQLYGFEFGWLGDTLLVLRKVPAIVRAAALPALLMALQGWLGQPGDNEVRARDELLRMLSSHAVPQQLPAYSLPELNTLLREYEAAPLPSAERPWRELAAADWQRLFELFS
jgi:DNA mismatch repair protein MutL